MTIAKRTLLVCFTVWAGIATARTESTLPPCPETAFTVAVIPDTQVYTGQDVKPARRSEAPLANPIFEQQVNWLVSQLSPQRIAFVSHVGDIVDINREEEWVLAAQILRPLHGRVPYALAVGNHDMSAQGDAHRFQRHFPAARFQDFPWYLESYTHDRADQHTSANNVNSAQIFSAGARDFIHLSLECNAPDDVLAWADALLTKHRGRIAFITTHMDLGVIEKPIQKTGYQEDPQGVMRWSKVHRERGNSPAQMWDKLYRKHANLRLVFSGDQSRATALHVARRGDHDNIVHHLMADTYHGPLRLYRVFPDEHRVDVITYDPIRNERTASMTYKPDIASHQFSLHVDLRRPFTAMLD